MEIQIGCSDPPPCDPQPSGKINKASFKLFGKRRSGNGMPSIFSIRNKGDTNDKELIRSKTHDGLTTTNKLCEMDCSGKEESASSDRLNGATTAPVCSAITKSFSFFSLLRRNSSRISDRAATLGQRGRGLKGLFNSIRWRRKPPTRDESIEIHDIVKEAKGVDLILSCSSKNVHIENVKLTFEPQIQILQDNVATWENSSLQDSNEETSSSALVQPVAEEFPALSLVTVQTQEVLGDKNGSPAHLSSMTPPQDHSSVDPPSEERLSSMFNDVTSLKSFDSLTGCGDIIADQEEDSRNGGSITSSGTGSSNGGLQVSAERCTPAKPPLPPQVTGLISMSTYTPARHRICPPTKTPQGSGIVAYMGGGEEMASPECVDDADMQGLWHMLPQKGDDSPALPHLPTRQDKRPPQVKGLGLSKIPVGGGSRVVKPQQHQHQLIRPSPPPIVKDLQDVPPSDEGYWDSSTPGPEDEDSGFLKCDGLLRDSCSGDALYDLYDLDSPGTVGSDDDSTISPTPSTGDLKMTPPSRKPSCSSFRSIKGSTSLPRESKIPISIKQKPASHSSSQGALSSPVSLTANNPSDSSSKANTPPRTRIPVSKVPVRSTGNKNAMAAQNRKLN
ncbi:APC membrane recruitment protein 2 [Bagarius yarrelli]|uniref:APC membrane recruitment protein 2 n=1 Tax=Bagarius yarrelli TaxID=175774 RepID=A0A556TWQ6_BAGYA|nr:APC membrane recruitment protein 2 [Bagarius yarrelli]